MDPDPAMLLYRGNDFHVTEEDGSVNKFILDYIEYLHSQKVVVTDDKKLSELSAHMFKGLHQILLQEQANTDATLDRTIVAFQQSPLFAPFYQLQVEFPGLFSSSLSQYEDDKDQYLMAIFAPQFFGLTTKETEELQMAGKEFIFTDKEKTQPFIDTDTGQPAFRTTYTIYKDNVLPSRILSFANLITSIVKNSTNFSDLLKDIKKQCLKWIPEHNRQYLMVYMVRIMVYFASMLRPIFRRIRTVLLHIREQLGDVLADKNGGVVPKDLATAQTAYKKLDSPNKKALWGVWFDLLYTHGHQVKYFSFEMVFVHMTSLEGFLSVCLPSTMDEYRPWTVPCIYWLIYMAHYWTNIQAVREGTNNLMWKITDDVFDHIMIQPYLTSFPMDMSPIAVYGRWMVYWAYHAVFPYVALGDSKLEEFGQYEFGFPPELMLFQDNGTLPGLLRKRSEVVEALKYMKEVIKKPDGNVSKVPSELEPLKFTDTDRILKEALENAIDKDKKKRQERFAKQVAVDLLEPVYNVTDPTNEYDVKMYTGLMGKHQYEQQTEKNDLGLPPHEVFSGPKGHTFAAWIDKCLYYSEAESVPETHPLKTLLNHNVDDGY